MIRLNGRKNVLRGIKESRCRCQKAYYMDDTVIISGVEDIKKYRVTKKGCFLYRMKARCSRFCVPESWPGDKVVDVCSAPGGKAMHALLCSKGEGSLSARDKTVSKVKKLRKILDA